MTDSSKSPLIKIPLSISKHIFINIIVTLAVMGLGHLIFYTFA